MSDAPKTGAVMPELACDTNGPALHVKSSAYRVSLHFDQQEKHTRRNASLVPECRSSGREGSHAGWR